MTDTNQHLDEGTIHAWLDGALAPDESARVEAHTTTCTACASLVAEARGLIAASSRILSSLDAVPAGVVPGSGRGADQLAALRARRTATSRRWWRDTRVVAAASVVFMAGTVSVIWRASTSQARLEQAAPVVVDAVSPAAGTPSAGAAASAPAESRARESNAAAPERAPAAVGQDRRATPAASPMPVVVTGVGAASSNKKTEPVTAAAPPPPVVANEAKLSSVVVGAARQAADSVSMARANRDVSADRLERQRAALSPRFEAQRLDSSSQNARRADVSSRALTAPTAGGASGLRLAEVTSSTGACYQLQVVPPGGQPSSRADTVRLLDEVVPERSDPLWRRARKVGALETDPVMMWREVDSVTVELRTRLGVASNLVQFLSKPVQGAAQDRDIVIRQLPNVGGQPGVQAALAQKVACPR